MINSYIYILSVRIWCENNNRLCLFVWGLCICSRVYSTWHREGVLQSRTSWIWLECVVAWAEKAIKIHISYKYYIEECNKNINVMWIRQQPKTMECAEDKLLRIDGHIKRFMCLAHNLPLNNWLPSHFT